MCIAYLAGTILHGGHSSQPGLRHLRNGGMLLRALVELCVPSSLLHPIHELSEGSISDLFTYASYAFMISHERR